MADVLVVTPEFPWPLESGSRIREYHSLVALTERFETTLVSLTTDSISEEARTHFDELGVTVKTIQADRSTRQAALRSLLTGRPYRAAKFSDRVFTETVGQLLTDETFDIVWLHFLETVTTLPATVGCPVILDQHNAERAYWTSFTDGSIVEKLYAKANIRFLNRFQRRYASRIDAVLSVDESDAEEAVSWAGEPIFVVPNGVDTAKFTPTTNPSDCAGTALFIGSLDLRMNEEALKWFVETAWPHVRKAVPDATFRIVGRNPSKRVTKLGDEPGVNLVGYVEDVKPHYDDAAVFVAPFAFGGGTKLKILEALAMERPVVTTPIGSKGIDVTDGTHAVIRRRGDGFAMAVTELIQDPADEIGEAGRRQVETTYAWQQIYDTAIDRVSAAVEW